MQIFKGIEAIRSYISEQKRLKNQIGLVPTMGALHAGHLHLVRQSLLKTDVTIATIFVNPLQFNNPADLTKYPRTIDQDISQLESVGCHAVFIPNESEIYRDKPKLTFDFGNLDKTLEGKFRPGHFNGVGIVVSKLFNIIRPDQAFFGQKDYQQFLVIKSLVDDLGFPITLNCIEIIREADGLAMSSRNLRLSVDDRHKAKFLSMTLSEISRRIKEMKFSELKKTALTELELNGIKSEYLELADRNDLTLIQEYDPTIPSVLLIAAYIGEVRLIDNMFV